LVYRYYGGSEGNRTPVQSLLSCSSTGLADIDNASALSAKQTHVYLIVIYLFVVSFI